MGNSKKEKGKQNAAMISIIRAEIDRLEDRFQQIETVVHD